MSTSHKKLAFLNTRLTWRKSLAILLTSITLLLGVLSFSGCTQPPSLTTVELLQPQARLEVTPQLGGRVLAFSLPGGKNLLSVGDAVRNKPNPKVSVEASFTDYRGQIVWLGPQSQWWQYQTLNLERARSKAQWPPDPFSTMGANTLIEQSPHRIKLQGINSPVNGMRIDKQYEVLSSRDNGVRLTAIAENIHTDKSVSWDVWLNARIPVTSKVYVPVSSSDEVRFNRFSKPEAGEILYPIQDGILSLEWRRADKSRRVEGKLFIQPSAGWMATFSEHQLWVTRFDLLPAESIHPEQGQVELYIQASGYPLQGVIEMEQHGAYTTLKPAENMLLQQEWLVFPYDGEDTAQAHRATLKQLAIANWH